MPDLMTSLDLAHLEKLAKAVFSPDLTVKRQMEKRHHLAAACSPDVVLALVARIRVLEKAGNDLDAAYDHLDRILAISNARHNWRIADDTLPLP